MSEPLSTRAAKTKRRSVAWVYYAILTVLCFIAVCSSGLFAGLIVVALFGLYASYLYRGGRFVIWFW